MILTKEIKNCILNPDASKAFATQGPAGINVVPVSSIKVVDDTIWLIDYFFGKTGQNIRVTNKVSLVCWSGLKGYQIKATVSYKTEGEDFEKARKWIQDTIPTRVVKAVIVLHPTEVFNISIDTLV